jgi:ferredoxin-NADP reductase
MTRAARRAGRSQLVRVVAVGRSHDELPYADELARAGATLARAAALKEWLQVARTCGCTDPAECSLFIGDSADGRATLPLVDADGCRRA